MKTLFYNSKKQLKKDLITKLLMVFMLLLTGCFGGEKSELQILDKTRVPANVGETLYLQKCSSCHGTLASSEKIGRTYTQIKSSIGSIPEMSTPTLTILTDAEIQLIADILDRDIPPGPPSSIKFKQILGGRKFMISKFKDLFSGNGTSPEELQIIAIIDAMKSEAGFMGGKATHYEFYTSPSIAAKQADADALVHPLASVPRRGVMTKTCQEVLSINSAVMNLLTRSKIFVTSPPTEANIGKVFNTMNPTTPINTTVSNGLIGLFQEAKNNQSMSDTDAWRFVIYTLCVSPTFELY